MILFYLCTMSNWNQMVNITACIFYKSSTRPLDYIFPEVNNKIKDILTNRRGKSISSGHVNCTSFRSMTLWTKLPANVMYQLYHRSYQWTLCVWYENKYAKLDRIYAKINNKLTSEIGKIKARNEDFTKEVQEIFSMINNRP